MAGSVVVAYGRAVLSSHPIGQVSAFQPSSKFLVLLRQKQALGCISILMDVIAV